MIVRVEHKQKPGPKPYESRQKLMPFVLAAHKLGIDPRTAKKLWNSGIAKIGGDLFIEQPIMCSIVLANVYGCEENEHDPLQPGSLECLIASGRLVL